MKSRVLHTFWLSLVLATGASAASNLDLARQLNQAFVEVAEKVSPSVVINVTHRRGAETLDFSDDSTNGPTPREFWRKFHQQFQDTPMEKVRGRGSGVIIRTNGYILTNRHVVEDAEKIQVRLRDGRIFNATVRGVDPHSDVAVLKIEATDLPVAKFASSANTRVGEFAIAIGAPFSLEYSVTFGHVSAKGRSNIVPVYSGGGMLDQDFIQTDANINPGNSGGPLVNLDGELIGINTLIEGLRTGIGFAIPSDLAREVSEQLITDGKFTRSWLGLSILGLKEIPEALPPVTGVDDGVLVRRIFPDGPAASSELRVGDVITKVDGQLVNSSQTLRNQVRGKKIGQPVTLEVFRKDETLRISVSPGQYPDIPPPIVARTQPRDVRIADLGLEVQWLTADEAKKFNVKLADGVIVTQVADGGLAHQRGIKPGDIITSANQERTFSPAQLREALRGADLKKGVRLELTSGENRRTETLKTGK